MMNDYTMSKEQIEEMAIDMCICCRGNVAECFDESPCDSVRKHANALYNAGYRKHREGEWKKMYDKAPRYVCTSCSHLYNNKEYKYCPNCGAKMKGGAE